MSEVYGEIDGYPWTVHYLLNGKCLCSSVKNAKFNVLKASARRLMPHWLVGLFGLCMTKFVDMVKMSKRWQRGRFRS